MPPANGYPHPTAQPPQHVEEQLALDLWAARKRRDAALARVDEHADDWDTQIVDQALRSFAQSGREFSLNDLRDLLPELRSRKLIGARVAAAHRRGEIAQVGWTISTSVHTNHTPIRTWRGTRSAEGSRAR